MSEFRLQFSKKHGRIKIDTEYNNLDPEVISKISSSLAHNEPFGLDGETSVWLFVPRDLYAANYSKRGQKWVKVGQILPDPRALEVFLSTCLYSHDHFIGPLACEKFLIAVKILNDTTC